ncbi:cleavage and polyadenylation specificity factor subunit 2 [Lingula anatina]|uniref:Cleavage and polyadenylation specificity factor subunit 2 n=1 Tax=Lingula anatina TaxID=7574 RepID=A0A1S3HFG1_LINAN|nr:cleavage and polyadenylation specificity factor subunit 2 [Lingula anatina]|eukprot:XP_013384817.1 cleavage and polyadenylation specificity factor subunit 2 [Lingula anatina]
MTSIIKLQVFSGAYDESPPCYLLQLDDFRFLLDCGWGENLAMDHINEVRKHLGQIDAVLLSHPDAFHLGALPYLVGKCGMNCPIYATIPVYKMGQMFMYDLYQSHHNTEDFNLFTLDDVDAAFDKIIQLKYSQSVSLKGKGHGLQITPLAAGHMIGGTIWKIVKDGEEEIIYAVDYNHKKERHLNGCVLDTFSRPHLLITDALNANYMQARRRARDEQLMTTILQTMRGSGNVLICLDTAGRVLELALLLDQMWRTQESGLTAYSLALLNNVSYNVVEFAKSQVEWMSDKIMRSFEDKRNNPFQFKHIQLCHSLAELAKVPEPKTVIASVPDLECGFSRDLFLDWCTNSKNSIILTNRTSPGTLARRLIDNPSQKSLLLEVRKRVKLEGIELEEYLKKEKEREAEEARIKAEEALKALDEESSDDSDVDMEADMQYQGKATKHDLMVKTEGKTRLGFFKQAKKSYPMFPFMEEKIRWDDYGEIIRPEDFMILETTLGEEDKLENTATEDSEMQDMSEIPTKCVSTAKTFNIQANIIFIDFEGRSDGESIKKILNQIKPRELILVHASQDATESLAEYCRSTGLVQGGRVFTPKTMEIVDATREGYIYQVRLKDSLISKIKLAKTRDIELGWVDGMLDLTKAKTDTSAKFEEADALEKKKLGAEDEDSGDLQPVLVSLPSNQVPGHSAVFINEPRLSDFKLVLQRAGISAEFSAGILFCCNGTVAVRRNEAGRIQLEGCVGADYFKVRELLYEQYAII